jgi:hypothetical protein
MNDGTAHKGGSGSRRLHPNGRPRQRFLRCPTCGSRFPTAELLDRHLIRHCHGLRGGAQLNLDDALAEQAEGFDGWSVFAREAP